MARTAEHIRRVRCDYCGAEVGEDCVTKSGLPYSKPLGHRDRRMSARAAQQQAAEIPDPPHNPDVQRANRVALAIWFIRKAGGVDHARKLLDRACTMLEDKGWDEPSNS